MKATLASGMLQTLLELGSGQFCGQALHENDACKGHATDVTFMRGLATFVARPFMKVMLASGMLQTLLL